MFISDITKYYIWFWCTYFMHIFQVQLTNEKQIKVYFFKPDITKLGHFVSAWYWESLWLIVRPPEAGQVCDRLSIVNKRSRAFVGAGAGSRGPEPGVGHTHIYWQFGSRGPHTGARNSIAVNKEILRDRNQGTFVHLLVWHSHGLLVLDHGYLYRSK